MEVILFSDEHAFFPSSLIPYQLKV